MDKQVFRYPTRFIPNLSAATTLCDSLLPLIAPMWNFFNVGFLQGANIERMTDRCFGDRHIFPKTLKVKHIKSLEGIYAECIAKNCYLPMLITISNQQDVFGSGLYCAEVLLQEDQYSVGEPPQFCRHNLLWDIESEHRKELYGLFNTWSDETC